MNLVGTTRKYSMKIMSLSFLVFMMISVVSVDAQRDIKLEVDFKLSAKYTKKPQGLALTAAAQMFPFINVTIKKIDYLIAFDQDSRKIKYIYTDDEDFKDAAGLKVGQEITIEWEDLDILGYFQLRGPADKSGWQPIVGDASAFEGDFLEHVEKAGKLITTIEGFAKGYNY